MKDFLETKDSILSPEEFFKRLGIFETDSKIINVFFSFFSFIHSVLC